MRHWIAALLAAPLVFAAPAFAADGEFTLVINDHKFQPETLEIPAGKKVTIIVENKDSSAEEFESRDLKIEKVIGGGKTGKVNVGPLKPGEYKFVGEFHEETAKGTLIAK